MRRVGEGDPIPEMLQYGIGLEDCPAFPGVYDLARLAAGASLVGAELVADGEAEVAFNPVGGFHHAGPANAEGFCYINDVVLACRILAERGLRVACVDLDVHHGNGTEDAFIDDPRVLTISTHESGKTLYPWRGEETVLGEGEARGYNVNIPLPEGTDDQAFRRAFKQLVLPLLRAHDPEVIVLEIGMDVLSGDPLAHFKMTNNATADTAADIRNLGVPVLALGGGGYNPRATARGWALSFMSLCDAEVEDDYAGAVGGVFLGIVDRTGGLRDMDSFASGEEREQIDAEVARVIAFHEEHTFPIWGIEPTGGVVVRSGRSPAR
jgi:acetoin utilization protein AcuC